MRFPHDVSPSHGERYNEIFATGDGERLLREWESIYEWDPRTGEPLALDIGSLKMAIHEGCLEFVMECLHVLPDRFFDVKRPLQCRDGLLPQEVIFLKLRESEDDPQEAARYHRLLEQMARRGWDLMHVAKVDGRDKDIKPLLFQLTGIRGSTPLLRRLLPYVGGAHGLRAYSDSYCGDVARILTPTTLLHRAVAAQDVEMLRFFVEEVGVSPNTATNLGRTALMTNLWVLISQSSGAAGRELLERGKEVLRVLVELGADVDHADKNGDTAMVLAVGDDNPTAVQLLIDLGADPAQRNSSDQSLLEIAEEKQCEAVARTLRSLEMGRMLGDAMPDGNDVARPSSRMGGVTL